MALTEEQKAKHKAGIAKFHQDGRDGLANTSAGSIKPPKSLANIKAKLSDLLPDCNNVIKQAIIGGLVAEREVWKGNDVELKELLDKDPSASLEDFELTNGKVVKVIVKYVPPDNKRIATAEWTIKQEIDLKKSMLENKNKSLDFALKKQKAENEGLIAKEDMQEKVKQEFNKTGLKALSVSDVPPPKPIYPLEDDEEEDNEIFGDED